MKIAIIGSGISALSSAYYLCKHNIADEIQIFEKDAEIGGHSKSFQCDRNNIELGFQVFNKRTYPNFIELLHELSIEYVKSDMSFSVKNANVEYGCKNLGYTLLHNSHFRYLLPQINNFYNIANKYLENPYPITYDNFCKKHNISEDVQTNFIIPLISSVWSVGTNKIGNVDMVFLLNFMNNHGLLDFNGEQWFILKNGSREYKKKIISYCKTKLGSKFKIITNHCVKKIEYVNNNVYVDDKEFVNVIIATPCDGPKHLIHNKTQLQSQILDGFQTTSQVIYVHKDKSFMPSNKNYWSSWNFIDVAKSHKIPTLTYWMKSLQHIDDENVFVTLNPPYKPDNSIYTWTTSHPQFNNSYKDISKIQGISNIYYVGAYQGYFFHEDGVVSALNVVNIITNKSTCPVFNVLQTKPNIGDVIFENIFFYLLRNCIQTGHLIVYYNNNKHVFGNTSSPPCYITITHPSVFKQIILSSDIGLGEAYMSGYIKTNELTKFLDCICMNYKYIDRFLSTDYNVLNYISHLANKNTIANSKKNIEYHYDLGNSFYKLWLDETMTYSSGIFVKGNTDDLTRAQLRKYDRIIDTLKITSADSVLEIGCGWGGFMKRCTERTGCKIVGITLSKQQFKYCKKRGYNVQYIDYRHMTGQFTKVVSIEMIEAVGSDNLHTYFNTIQNRLEPNGSAMIQAICFPTFERFKSATNNTDFIKKYIFPGGQCPCLEIIDQHIKQNKMKITDVFEFGQSYATTLDIWQSNFNKTWDLQTKFDERFKNMWNFYLSYCSSAFRYNLQCLKQIAFTKTSSFTFA